MTTISKIEWTEQTWNPTVGCTKISPGCKHCYAEAMAKRLKAMGTPGYENGFALTLLPERFNDPIKRKKPTVYFVNSMSDLFHERVPDAYIDKVFGSYCTNTAPYISNTYQTSRSGWRAISGSVQCRRMRGLESLSRTGSTAFPVSTTYAKCPRPSGSYQLNRYWPMLVSST